MNQSSHQRAEECCQAADRRVRWATKTLNEMRAHGAKCDFDELERAFSGALVHLASAHDLIADAAKHAGLNSFQESLQQLRHTDQLLYYLWKARDIEVHTPLIVYQRGAQEISLRVVDAEKARPIAYQFSHPINVPPDEAMFRLLRFAFEASTDQEYQMAIESGRPPSARNLDIAGVELISFAQSLTLAPFTTRVRGKPALVQRPEQHLEEPIAASAIDGVSRAVQFYAQQLSLLLDPIRGEASRQAPPTDRP